MIGAVKGGSSSRKGGHDGLHAAVEQCRLRHADYAASGWTFAVMCQTHDNHCKRVMFTNANDY
ncbi:hypothetical protein E1H18_4234 [Caulobacter sp. RHG1]|nr:hypothetical protein [Caulobacter sp. RHG1]